MKPKEVVKAAGYVIGYGALLIISVSVAWELVKILTFFVQVIASDVVK